MDRRILLTAYVALMIAVIVVMDVTLLRNHLGERLLANVGIVALFIACYLLFARRR